MTREELLDLATAMDLEAIPDPTRERELLSAIRRIAQHLAEQPDHAQRAEERRERDEKAEDELLRELIEERDDARAEVERLDRENDNLLACISLAISHLDYAHVQSALDVLRDHAAPPTEIVPPKPAACPDCGETSGCSSRCAQCGHTCGEHATKAECAITGCDCERFVRPPKPAEAADLLRPLDALPVPKPASDPWPCRCDRADGECVCKRATEVVTVTITRDDPAWDLERATEDFVADALEADPMFGVTRGQPIDKVTAAAREALHTAKVAGRREAFEEAAKECEEASRERPHTSEADCPDSRKSDTKRAMNLFSMAARIRKLAGGGE